MTVDQSDKIDFTTLSKDGKRLALIITDPFSWNDAEETRHHLTMLQAKLNLYYGFIEGDQILQHYPQARNLQIVIDVAFKHEPNETAVEFLQFVKAETKKDGIDFTYSVSAD